VGWYNKDFRKDRCHFIKVLVINKKLVRLQLYVRLHITDLKVFRKMKYNILSTVIDRVQGTFFIF